MTDFNALQGVTVGGQEEGSEVVKVMVTFQFNLWFGRLIGVPTLTLAKVSEMPRWRND